ncbi:probable protein phosphatase 2C 72 [Punica granatum]|uniref:PPM-type phosphatase domain-containing protein n=2 Tax=Punica granatum TaxID=22663 RepID=A0A218VU68_PUNGR|nr:probable protein phosphatase 2C 72 [Punica granatum]OWM63442.1 hypothetical protein CDL15_Pgr022187 [Punica granatum]PKI72499.1 hypothetical protein CRG98_007102 [Punica granatum]
MGLCVSSPVSSEIHNNESTDQEIFHENAIYCEAEGKIHLPNGTQGMVGSVYSRTGSKGLNQDSAILYQGYGMHDGAFCGVYDGHGKNGHLVSNIVRNRLHSLVLNQKNTLAGIKVPSLQYKETEEITSEETETSRMWSKACASAFKVMDKEVKLQENIDYSTSGTTAVVVIRQGEELVIANLGDSRAVLGRLTEDGRLSAVQLTSDLKPSVPSEAERIRKCNGRVLALKDEPHIQRVWLPHEDMPGLAMSRAFGDFLLKNHGIIAVPDISYHRISPEDQFVVLATDGVWDVMGNDEVMAVVRSAMEVGNPTAKAVVDAAVSAWKRKFPSSKIDDCTVVCLFLQKTQDKDAS